METEIRFARPKDISTVLFFIRQLAAYEGMSDQVAAIETLLEEWMFQKRAAECLLLFTRGELVGFALFYHNFSTFRDRGGIYLEDLYVDPRFRGRGFGTLLLKRLAAIAAERDCRRLEWCCLNWNTAGINFYKGLGAQPMDQWTAYRLEGEALTRLAGEGDYGLLCK